MLAIMQHTRRGQEICFDARPHLNPLPQERTFTPPRFFVLRKIVRLIPSHGISNNLRTILPLLEERAGVRTVVKTNLLFQKRFELPFWWPSARTAKRPGCKATRGKRRWGFSAEREWSQLAADGITRDGWNDFAAGLLGDALRIGTIRAPGTDKSNPLRLCVKKIPPRRG